MCLGVAMHTVQMVEGPARAHEALVHRDFTTLVTGLALGPRRGLPTQCRLLLLDSTLKLYGIAVSTTVATQALVGRASTRTIAVPLVRIHARCLQDNRGDDVWGVGGGVGRTQASRDGLHTYVHVVRIPEKTQARTHAHEHEHEHEHEHDTHNTQHTLLLLPARVLPLPLLPAFFFSFLFFLFLSPCPPFTRYSSSSSSSPSPSLPSSLSSPSLSLPPASASPSPPPSSESSPTSSSTAALTHQAQDTTDVQREYTQQCDGNLQTKIQMARRGQELHGSVRG
jgi:hypothetical protein